MALVTIIVIEWVIVIFAICRAGPETQYVNKLLVFFYTDSVRKKEKKEKNKKLVYLRNEIEEARGFSFIFSY
jgi:hypothetical protein